LWHPLSKDLWITKPFDNCHCSNFTMDKMKHNSPVFMHWSQQELISLADVVYHCYSASVTAPWFVTKCCSSCCCFCDPPIPCQITLTSTTASLCTLNRCSWMQVSLSPLAVRSSVPARCLNHMSVSAILDSTVMLLSEEWNSFI
jgi:hypothetical protein